MSEIDYYAVLGVMPDSEDLVITAAYRALVQYFQRMKQTGDPKVALQRIAALDEAYATLGRTQTRAAYDKTHPITHQIEFCKEDADKEAAFSAALEDPEIERKWKTACSVVPDLQALRQDLARISAAQAFAFVTILLETRQFEHRAEIVARMEKNCLRRYFGTNKTILSFARSLIFSGQCKAAKALNQLVAVMGSDVDPALLITRIRQEYATVKTRWTNPSLQTLKHSYSLNAAINIINTIEGYSVEAKYENMWQLHPDIEVRTPNEGTLCFERTVGFKEWVLSHL